MTGVGIELSQTKVWTAKNIHKFANCVLCFVSSQRASQPRSESLRHILRFLISLLEQWHNCPDQHVMSRHILSILHRHTFKTRDQKSTYCTQTTYLCSVICEYLRNVIVVPQKSVVVAKYSYLRMTKNIFWQSCFSTLQRNSLRKLHKCHNFCSSPFLALHSRQHPDQPL